MIKIKVMISDPITFLEEACFKQQSIFAEFDVFQNNEFNYNCKLLFQLIKSYYNQNYVITYLRVVTFYFTNLVSDGL